MVRDTYQTGTLPPDSPSQIEEVSYLLMTAERIQATFATTLPPHLAARLESEHRHFHSLKDKLTGLFVAGSKKTWSDLLLLGVLEQNWMISQRFSRTPNLAHKVESTECENLYCAWLFLNRRVRTAARVYRDGGLPLHQLLVPALKLYLEFFSEAFEVLAATVTSVQRQEAFVRDVKLITSLIESVAPLTNNVSETPRGDGVVQYLARFPDASSVDPLDYVVLVRKLQLLRAHLRFLLKCLGSNGAELAGLVEAVRNGLFRNRLAVSKSEEVQKTAQSFVEQMKREAVRHSASVREM